MTDVFIVHQGENPSTDFFVKPALKEQGCVVRAFGFRELPEDNELERATVVFVRYVPPAWKIFLKEHRPARVVLFMDDDLFDLSVFRGMPWHYQRKLFRLAWRHQSWLRRLGAELWVSSPRLAEKYAGWNPKLLQPRSPHPLPGDYPEPEVKTVFYHGSASHRAELDWLLPVFEQVLGNSSDVCVELMGDRKVRDRFAHLPGVQVVHPMSWLAYKRFIRRPGRTIGLAPLLDSSFNAARSPTKLFDITAAGAVGVYADHPVYQGTVRKGESGLLLPMDSQLRWADHILELLVDDVKRHRMHESALATVY